MFFFFQILFLKMNVKQNSFEKAKRLASKKHDLLRKNLSVEVCVYNFVNIYTYVWKSLFPFVLFNVALFQFGKP